MDRPRKVPTNRRLDFSTYAQTSTCELGGVQPQDISVNATTGRSPSFNSGRQLLLHQSLTGLDKRSSYLRSSRFDVEHMSSYLLKPMKRVNADIDTDLRSGEAGGRDCWFDFLFRLCTECCSSWSFISREQADKDGPGQGPRAHQSS